MFNFNIARITEAAAKGRNPATPEDVRLALGRPEGDAYYAVNCADAWADHQNDDPAELYCSYGTACDCVDLNRHNIGPSGDTQCKDCAMVEDAKERAFEREHAHWM